MNNNDVKSLSHSKWRCQYHIAFAPKYRRKTIYGRIKGDIGNDQISMKEYVDPFTGSKNE